MRQPLPECIHAIVKLVVCDICLHYLLCNRKGLMNCWFGPDYLWSVSIVQILNLTAKRASNEPTLTEQYAGYFCWT